ncbi:uncharacterized protein SPAPADRAFT_55519 [Spathaspora passalidarum NRRL Y-27907]|uniref:Uncharacterized protein n=1 Tax=Spathaspora passalidarum (strain NRRL Y-27907 / 11-Y1) TaxID=619300 RepID=G3ANE9_SPAPN|nr:uncharacterized protein SPAPADRAFT_55519 [Spathaspora passalidarum NRRL Y-27907]EGW31938.1 hypothetical protein SPAPADRAFT_55519 [Spathaspora passalidarum NRRL Y-27907]
MHGLSEKENDIPFLAQDLMVHPNNSNGSISNQTPNGTNGNSPKRNSNSPLSQSNKINQVSPFRRKLQQHHKSASLGAGPESDATTTTTTTTTTTINEHEDYKTLERQFTDTLLKYNALHGENARLEHELAVKSAEVETLQEKVKHVEEKLVECQFENTKQADMLHKQMEMYKDSIDDLQIKIINLTEELEMNRKVQTESVSHDQNEMMHKYHKLVRDYKVLSSDFEVERSSKSALIEQIELLLREKDVLKQQVEMASQYDEDFDTQGEFLNDFDQPTHNMTQLSNDEDPALPHHSRGISLLDDISHSSPIKYDTSHESLHVDSNFQFPSRSNSIQQQPTFDSRTILSHSSSKNSKLPPSPDPNSKNRKRQSLPTPSKRMSHIDEHGEFVLSPFKLQAPSFEFAEPSASRTSCPSISTVLQAHSADAKAGHKRFNSHDLIPISVEFEKVDQSTGVRSTSMPEGTSRPTRVSSAEQRQQGFDLIPESEHHRDEALFALNGGAPDTSFRLSETASSSKRSSYISDDKTRQEIMKLKFELQSLKLHNEKLLSYIGFELQKQKKNIKRLSKKQSQQSLLAAAAVAGSPNRNFEYSDAKLIESSRDVLINKKRVLRSVSINAILGNNYNRYDRDSIELNERNAFSSPTSQLDRDIFDEIYDIDYETESDSLEQEKKKTIKKFASEVFSKRGLYSLSEDEVDGEDDVDDDGRDDETTCQEESSSPYTSDEEIGMFNQIRYLVTGNDIYRGKKKKKNPHLVDDGLKFKFLTIALGIAIIAVKLTPQRSVSSTA